MDCTAHLMVRNEEYYIRPVLESVLQAGFKEVILADCGSTDLTWTIASQYLGWPGFRLYCFGVLTPQENGQVRQFMTDVTHTPWAMLVDGDEFYWPSALKHILAQEMPDGRRFGFTTLANVQHDSEGYYVASLHSKQAVFDVQTKWGGAYPFENPDSITDANLAHYFGHAVPGIHGLHLHCLRRSPYDNETYLRTQKMQDHTVKQCLRRLRWLPVPESLAPSKMVESVLS